MIARRTSAAAAVALLTACAGTTPASQPTRVAEYSSPVVLLVSPDSVEVERMRRELGADFEVVADDAMWYRAEARALLDSLRIPYADVGRGAARFRVAGTLRDFSWRRAEGAWFSVLYDGRSEPKILPDAELREHLSSVPREASR